MPPIWLGCYAFAGKRAYSVRARIRMDKTLQSFSASANKFWNMFSMPHAFVYANGLCDEFERTLTKPSYMSMDLYKYGLRQHILRIWRKPSLLWLDLPYDAFRRVPDSEFDVARRRVADFVYECFVHYSQQMHDEARNEVLQTGGFTYCNKPFKVKQLCHKVGAAVFKPVPSKKKKSRVSHKPNKKCNRMTSAELKMNPHILGRFGGDHVFKRAPKFPIFQSGGRPVSFVKIVSKTTHAERDLEQANVVKRKAREEFKKKSKLEREVIVKARRDKRNPACEFDDCDFQGGNVVKIVAGVVGAFVAGRVSVAIGNTISAAGNVVHEANRLFKQLKSFTKNPVWMIPVACIAVFLLGKPIFQFAFSVLINLMGRFFPKALWKELSPHVGDVTMQDGGDVLGKIMAVTCVFSIFKGLKFDHRTMTEFIKRMSCLTRLSESLSAFTGWIVQAFECAINFFRGLFGKESMSFKFRKVSKLDAWNKNVEKVLKEYQTVSVTPTPAVIDSWLSLVGEAHELREIYRGTPMYRGICEMYDKLLVVLKPYKGSINARNNYRVEPEMILLTGAPGIGKTVLTMALSSTILKRSGLVQGDAEQVMREIWQKGCSEYWNGYAGQKALIIDDAFQMHGDKTDKDNDFINVIRSVSSWAFPLNFADVESKGAIYFSSQLIVATTNRTNLEYGREMIHDMDAVYRRIGHGYELKLNPQFALPNGRLNEPLLRAAEDACPLGTYPWHVWSLVKHDFKTGSPTTITRSLEEVVNEIADTLIRKNAAHADGVQRLSRYINSMEVPPPVAAPVVQMQAGNEFPVDKKIVFWRNQEDVMDQKLQYRVLTPLDERLLDFSNWLSHSFLSKGWNLLRNVNKAIDRQIARLVISLDVGEPLSRWLFHYLGFVVRFTEFCLLFGGAKKVVKAVVGIVKSVLGIFWHDDKEDKPEVVPQSNEKVPIRNLTNVALQDGNLDVINNVESNCYYMLCHNKGETTVDKLGTGIFVCDTLMVYPEHFKAKMRLYPDGDVYFINRHKPEFNFNVPVIEFLKYKDHTKDEVTFVSVDNVRSHRNITRSFLQEKDLLFCAGKPSVLVVADVNTSKKGDDLKFDVKSQMFEAATTTWNPRGATFATMKLPRFFQINAATMAGNCGSPLLTRKSTLFGGSCVMGFHIAGDNFSRAYSMPISQEMLKEAKDKLKIIEDKFVEDLSARGVSHQCGEAIHLADSCSMLPLCVLDKGVAMAQKTNFYKTQYHGVLGDCGMAPARQRPYMDGDVLKYPMLNAVKPYDTPLVLFDDHFDDLVHVAMSKFTALSRDAPRHIMDFDTAVKGEPKLEYFRSIPRSTAAGFPYSVQYGSGKKAFFGDGLEYDLTSEPCNELRVRVKHVIDSARENVRLSHVFTDFLKDELRSYEKVSQGKTRMISASPLDYTIAFRMYFGCFMASVMKHHIFSGMAPGVCVFTEWDSVLVEMTSKGDKICAGDFKSFDCSEQPPLHWAILDYVNKWYNDGNDQIRRILWLELVHSRHLGGLGNDQKFVYQWNHSLPSGHPFTTIVNSMYSLCALVYAVTKTLKKPYCVFWTVANALTYGDDNLLNASDEVVSQLPVKELAAHMSKLGLVYTSDSKGTELEDWRPSNEVTFLKRSFRRSDGRVNAPLELESFLYTFYYCKNKKLEKEIFIDVMENALEELSMHGQEQWDEFAPRLYELLSEKVVPRAPCQRESYLELIKIRSDNWF